MIRPVLPLAASLCLLIPACAQPVDDEISPLDADGDGTISETEFADGGGAGDFDTYDLDRDRRLSVEEYDEIGLEESDAFDTYDADADGFLDETEYAAGSFATYDTNRDGLMDATEADSIGPGIGDAGQIGY